MTAYQAAVQIANQHSCNGINCAMCPIYVVCTTSNPISDCNNLSNSRVEAAQKFISGAKPVQIILRDDIVLSATFVEGIEKWLEAISNRGVGL